jgi:hypothetical protein
MIRIRFQGFKLPILFASASVLLTACDPSGQGGAKRVERADSAEAGYLPPPALEGVQRTGGRLTLAGRAAPDADVRLGSPDGEVLLSKADRAGRWTVVVPTQPGVRLFGLSMTREGRTVQAEGYVMVSEEGHVALLRSGAGAWRVSPASSAPRILAVDIDRAGGAVVSGVAAPGAGLNVRVDRVVSGGGRADDNGRFFIALKDPVTRGPHDIQIGGEGGEDQIMIAATPPLPLRSGPVRSERVPTGWRIDWMTPGGGVQTTLLIRRDGR